MRRERLEIGWYAVRPFLIYIVLFITIRSVLYRLLESVLLAASADMTAYYTFWHDAADLMILGIASAGSVLPLLKDGQREIMVTRARSAGAWIAHRKDSRLLMGLLPFGTICLSAFLNLVLAGSGPQNAASMHPAVLPGSYGTGSEGVSPRSKRLSSHRSFSARPTPISGRAFMHL